MDEMMHTRGENEDIPLSWSKYWLLRYTYENVRMMIDKLWTYTACVRTEAGRSSLVSSVMAGGGRIGEIRDDGR